ncbi:MAG: hypothetical protein J3T61_06415 [Candidatus Brocadiales bacterium]|nr:hypothetical protein [Candidatus Bathyanammoxibius sp.]
MDYERELIPLARLRLNTENDRHGPLPSEHECIEWLLTNHRNHMTNLAKDIAEYDLSPIDGILVLPAGDEAPGDYIVWEGNRRAAALKILDDPNRCHDSKNRRRFSDIRSKAKVTIAQDVECTIAPSVEEAERLIELRHQGPQEGVGTVPWDPKQKSRHQQRLGKRGRYAFSQQVIDAIADKLDDELKEKVLAKRFPISTLDRVLSNTFAREFLGLSTEGGLPQRVLEEKETFKGLTRVLQDIAQGMPVREVYNSEQIREYLGNFDKKDIPDKKKMLSEPVPLSMAESGADPHKATRARSRQLAHLRKKLIPPGVIYSIEDSRVNAIYRELKRLNVDTYRNAAAVLFRVFLELSVELYLDEHGIKYDSYRDKLKEKAKKVVEDMNRNGWLDRKGSKGINVTISSQDNPHSVDTFHAYVHNRHFHPQPSELNTAWDRLQPFFDALFGHIG